MQCLARDPEAFPRLKEEMTRLAVIDCSQYSNPFICRRVDVRLRATSISSYVEYSQLLARSAEERERLKKELTIHITGFFRDPTMWEALRLKAVPRLLASRGGRQGISALSAGSSTGEEALSLAVCFSEALGKGLKGLSILGIDLDADTIHRAHEAVYEDAQFREMPQQLKERYFERVGEGLYMPVPAIRALVSFRQGDIIADKKPQGLDVILCRNTVIYFDAETKARLYEEFYGSLAKGGILVLGKTELLQGNARNLFKVFDAKERIYVKE